MSAAAVRYIDWLGFWYVGVGSSISDPVAFADHLGSDLSETIASASPAPGSDSGSSGGGSAGGGGGGG